MNIRLNHAAAWITALLVAATIVMLSAAAPGAGAGAEADDPHNAATWYRCAFVRLRTIPAEDWNAVTDYYLNPAAPPSQRVRDILAQAQPALELVRRAVQESEADFGIDYSQGLATTLPHLQPMRQLARLAAADSALRLHDGDSAGASEQLAAAMRLADHATRDGVAINSLIGAALFKITDQAVQSGIDRGTFSAEDAARLLASSKSISGADPFGFIQSVDGEREHVVGWAMHEYSGDEGFEKFKKDIAVWLPEGQEELAAQFAGMTQPGLQLALEQADAVMERVTAAFGMPDPVDAKFELEQISKELEHGDHGPIAGMLMPAWGRLYDSMTQTRELLERRQAMLDDLAAGRATPDDLRNAAVEYLAAIAALDAVDEKTNSLIRSIAKQRKLPEDVDQLQAAVVALQDLQPIMDTVRAASTRKRCDFSIAPDPRPSALLGYAAGLCELARLLQADEINRVYAGEWNAAIDRLGISYRMSVHLAADKAILSSLAAQWMFARTTALVSPLVREDRLTAEQRTALRAPVERMAGRDPFGLARSIAAERTALINDWLDAVPPSKSDQLWYRQTMDTFDGEALLRLAAASDGARPPTADADRQRMIERLDEVMDTQRLLEAIQGWTNVRDAIAAGKIDLLLPRDPPAAPIGRVAERQAEALATVRAALNLLREPEAAAPQPIIQRR